MKTLAIDFGTSHSYFTICPTEAIRTEAINFGSSHGLETAVLYRGEGDLLIGGEAFEEYGIALAEERKHYKIRLQFKPEICDSEEASKNTFDFLSQILRKRPDLLLDVERVLIGVPCEASPEFSNKIIEIAKKAGYGLNIETVEEPRGALLHYIASGDIHPEDALEGTLIIDFGGGTCDFAYMFNGRPVCVWGDMEYGGRIFDDLFFQWFVDQSPKVLKKVLNENQQYFVLFYECRKAKEHFSEIMKQRDKIGNASSRITDYGFIRDMTWDEFWKRASNYSPSDIFLKWMEETGSCQKLYSRAKDSIDLIEWFKDQFAQGVTSHQLRDEIRQVVLAGGSSLWSWVREFVSEELGIPVEKIRESNNPYAVISEGLSVLPALEIKNEKTKKKLQKDFPNFLDSEILPLFDKKFDEISSRIAKPTSVELYEIIYPVLEDFRENGGKIASLKKEISKRIVSYEPQFKNFVEKEILSWTKALRNELKGKISDWFKRYDLFVPKVKMGLNDIGELKEANFSIETSIGDVIYAVTAVTAGIVTTAVCGGGGVAIITAGPLGLIIGAAISVAVWFASRGLLGKELKHLSEKVIEDLNIPPTKLGIPISKAVLPEGKIEKFQKDLEKYLTKQIYDNLKRQLPELGKQIEGKATGLISALSEINHIEKRG